MMPEKPVTLRLDLEKMQHTSHHLYFVRLLWSLNDLLSTIQTREAVKHCQQTPEEFKVHLLWYVTRLECAHLVEACKSFVLLVSPPKNQKPIYAWITQHHEIKLLFDSVRLLLDDPLFKKVSNSRNSVVFHYNHKEDSSVIDEAFKKLAVRSKRFTSDGQSDLNLLQRDEAVNSRFFVADHLMRIAWFESLGTTLADFDTSIGQFQKQLKGQFLDYAEEAFLAWALEEKLFLEAESVSE